MTDNIHYEIHYAMSSEQLKEALYKRIEQADDKFLRILHAMTEAYFEQETPMGYELDGTPIFASQLGEELDKEVELAEKGDYTSIDELEKKSAEWIRSTK